MTRMTRTLGATLAGSWIAGVLAFWVPGAAGLAVFLAVLAIVGPGRVSIGRLRVEIQVPDVPIHEHDEVDLGVAVESRQWRRLAVSWRLHLPPLSQSDAAQGELALARGTTRIGLKTRFLLFGRTRVGPLVLRSSDALGFAVDERVAAAPQDVRVQPHIEALRDTFMPAKQERPLMGAYEVSQPGSGMEFFGLRDYQPGDRPRDVNWKATARVGKMVVNQFQRESTVDALVLVDVRAASLVGRRSTGPAASACRMALAVAHAHLARRDDARLVLLADQVIEANATGQRKKDAMVDLVTDVLPAGTTDLMSHVKHLLPTLRRHTPVFLASAMVGDPTAVAAVALLRSHDMPVVVAVLRPDFGEHAGPDVAAWQAAQDDAVGQLRGVGARVIVASPGEPLETLLPMLEVDA